MDLNDRIANETARAEGPALRTDLWKDTKIEGLPGQWDHRIQTFEDLNSSGQEATQYIFPPTIYPPETVPTNLDSPEADANTKWFSPGVWGAIISGVATVGATVIANESKKDDREFQSEEKEQDREFQGEQKEQDRELSRENALLAAQTAKETAGTAAKASLARQGAQGVSTALNTRQSVLGNRAAQRSLPQNLRTIVGALK